MTRTSLVARPPFACLFAVRQVLFCFSLELFVDLAELFVLLGCGHMFEGLLYDRNLWFWTKTRLFLITSLVAVSGIAFRSVCLKGRPYIHVGKPLYHESLNLIVQICSKVAPGRYLTRSIETILSLKLRPN